MKFMKKLAIILAVFTLVLLVDGGIAAAVTESDLTDNSYASPATVTLTLKQSFEITLPTAFNFGTHNAYLSASAPLMINIHRLNESAVLYLNLTGGNSTAGQYFNLTDTSDSSKRVQYIAGLGSNADDHIEGSDRFVKHGEWLYNSNDNESVYSGYVHLRTLNQEVKISDTGEYVDTLTFTIHVVEPVAP